MAKLTLSLAACDYDHLRDLFDGKVKPEGIDIVPMVFDEPHHIFHRMAGYTEFDISEMSFGGYSSLVSRKQNKMIAIPVFPSRVARISSFYVAAGSKIKTPKELEGGSIGVPQWAQTATIYARGWLATEAGVDLKKVRWVQTGVDEPARDEIVEVKLPKGYKLDRVRDRSLTQMLLDKDLDCIISALPPKPFRDGSPRIKRLVRNYRKMEEEYFLRTKIFPIMHLITIKKTLLDAHPWVAMSLYEAFEEAKNNALRRALKASHAIYPVPWASDDAARMQKMFGADLWPYGLEPNRPTIEAFLQFGFDQGVCSRKVTPEELFVPSTLDVAKA